MPVTRKTAVVTALAGLAAGVMSGLLGVGGGIVMVPLLVAPLGLTQHRAHATSLAAIVPIAAVGVLRFMAAGNVDYAVAGLLALGGLAGAPIGAWIMTRAKEPVLRTLFGVLLIVVAIQLLWP